MANLLRKISRNARNITTAMSGASKRVDYENLARYVIEISRVTDLESIFHHTSICLKGLLDYRLFGFAVRHGDDFDAWVDPGVYSFALRNMIEKDFQLSGDIRVHKRCTGPSGAGALIAFDSRSLTSHVITGEMYYGKVYLLPGRRMSPHQPVVMELVLKALGAAIANFLDIKKLKSEAACDQLTDCYNRRQFDRLMDHDVPDSQRHKHDLSVIMFDIDHFKKVNDSHGHWAGDHVLRGVAGLVKSIIRKGDYITRFGGEEFIVTLPNTSLPKAILLAERLRAAIENLEVPLPDERTLKITASFGVATLSDNPDREKLVEQADLMLYRAKGAGRNKVMPGPNLHVVPIRAGAGGGAMSAVSPGIETSVRRLDLRAPGVPFVENV